jgi:uncharacterized protein YndB with AHSA1/START domain
MSNKLEHSYQIIIQATPEQVWQALTDARFTTQYFPNTAVESDWQAGSDYSHKRGDAVAFDGKVVVSDRPRRLVQTVHMKFDPAVIGHKEITLSWDIEQMGESCMLTIGHEGSESDRKLFEHLTGHCPHTLSGIKTLLETGKPLSIPQPVAAER